MDAYRVTVWLHILFGIVLTGQALFWMIMLVALRQRFGTAERQQWLSVAKGARWPHVVVPYALRLPLPLVAWVTIAMLLITGAYAGSLTRAPEGIFWSAKEWLLGGVLLAQTLLTWRPIPAAIIANLVLTLGTMIVSAWLVRG